MTLDDPKLSLWQDGAPLPCPRRFNTAQHCVFGPAERHPAKDALLVVDGNEPTKLISRWSFEDMDAAVRRAAGALLAAGLQRGDRVLIWLGDGPDFPIAYFGAMAAGGVAMPLSAQLSKREVERIAHDASPRLALLTPDAPLLNLAGAVILTADDLHDARPAQIEDTSAEDPALLIYTSGSSGTPKGVLHAHRAIHARHMMHLGWHDIRASDRVMHAGAFNWTYTLGVGLSDPWSVGATAILNAGTRTPEAWPALAAEWKPTVFAAVPGVFRRILKYCDDLRIDFSSLRHAVTAGEKLHSTIFEGWQSATGKPLLEALGMSEVSTYISASPTRNPQPGYAGWPQPGRRVAVLGDDGTPAPRGTEGALVVDQADAGLMIGYWNREKDTQAAFAGGWFHTGDRAVMSEDGSIAYAGRTDDQINAQGYRVSPLEIEEALLTHPEIAEAGAAELSVVDGLSILAAWIVPASDAAITRAAVLAHLTERLASYKVPREVFIASALPRSANGKLLRRELCASGAQILA